MIQTIASLQTFVNGKTNKKNWDFESILIASDNWQKTNLVSNITKINVKTASEIFTFPRNGISLARVIEYAQKHGQWYSEEFRFLKPYILTALKTGVPLHCFINAVTTETEVDLYVAGCEVSSFISGRSLEDIVSRVLIHEDLHAGGMEEAEIREHIEPMKFSILSEDETKVFDLAVH